MCEECYCENARKTPLLHPRECLEKHLQYICGSCGRCICIQADEKRGLQHAVFAKCRIYNEKALCNL